MLQFFKMLSQPTSVKSSSPATALTNGRSRTQVARSDAETLDVGLGAVLRRFDLLESIAGLPDDAERGLGDLDNSGDPRSLLLLPTDH